MLGKRRSKHGLFFKNNCQQGEGKKTRLPIDLIALMRPTYVNGSVNATYGEQVYVAVFFAVFVTHSHDRGLGLPKR